MADPKIRIIVEAITREAERALERTQRTIKETGQEGIKADGALATMGKSLKVLGMVAAGAVAGVAALKKVLDFGKEGAAIAQTRDSWNRLIASMGAAPDTLQQLSEAARGTVDDLTLMSSTLTLLAGASDTLASAMLASAPQLMEIAKAANKLNPSLGTTAQMYEALATGIKRSSPLILDNLGLTIKIGEANARYAEQLGKTVDQLTAEEKQMALLTATLEAGDRMIEQVGGTTEAMGDSFAEAEAKLKNASDTMKARLVPVLADVADALADGIELAADHAAAVERVASAAMSGAESYEEYLDAFWEYAEAAGMFRGVVEGQLRDLREYALGLEEGSISTQRLARETGILTEEQYDARKAMDTLAGGLDNFVHASDPWIERQQEAAQVTAEVGDQLKGTTGQVDRYRAHLLMAMGDRRFIENQEELARKQEEVAAAASAAADAQDAFRVSMDKLGAVMRGDFGAAVDAYRAKLAELDEALATGEIKKGEYKAALDEQAAAFGRNTQEIMFNIAQKQILDALEKGLIEDVNKSGTAYDEATEAMWRMALEMGLVDDATLALWEATAKLTDQFITGEESAGGMASKMADLARDTTDAAAKGTDLTVSIAGWEGKHELSIRHNLDDALREAQMVGDAVRNLPSHKTITIDIKTVGTLPGMPEPMQHGGAVHAGAAYLVGEAGPELFVSQSPGYIVPNHEITHHNYNLSIHTSAPAESALSDFHIMRALAGV